jgi:hypothetical protein
MHSANGVRYRGSVDTQQFEQLMARARLLLGTNRFDD